MPGTYIFRGTAFRQLLGRCVLMAFLLPTSYRPVHEKPATMASLSSCWQLLVGS
jgi:hypothetical protein